MGAGEVAESAMEAFKSRGSQEITVTGRTFDWCPLSRNKPDELAEKYGGYALAYSQFKNSLHHFDVILTSTSSGKSLLGEYEIKAAMAKRPAKPLFLVDASVPRNIDPRVSRIDNVFLYNMDDVSEIANENLKSRIAEVDRCRLTLSKRQFVYGVRCVLNQLTLIPQVTNQHHPFDDLALICLSIHWKLGNIYFQV